MDSISHKLRKQLASTLPGEVAQFRMAPKNRRKLEEELPSMQLRQSAVMLLLYERQGQIYLPLIQRHSYEGAHSAQVSLPGGKFEAADETLERTAVRECYEEIGIEDIEVLGALSRLHIPISGFMVQPFVGITQISEPVFRAQEREVKEVLALSINQLLDEKIIERGMIDLENKMKIESPWYNIEGRKVWGATAMILSEFTEVYRSIL